MIRAAAYIRVSTERQAEEDRVSLDEQHKDIASYCQGRGYTVVKEYQDVGSGASKRRPLFQQMLRDVQDGAFDVIVCWKSDRLSRGLYPAAALSEALEGTDIGLESVKDTIDRNIFDLMAVVGKIELNNIRDRARMGSRGRASKGKIAGTPKYGYASGPDATPVIVEEEAQLVRRVFSEYIEGSGQARIAERLNQEGILTRKGHLWEPARINEMITCPAYMGKGVFGQRQFFKRDNGERDVRHIKWNKNPDSWVTIEYPAIIEQPMWELAQTKRRDPARRKGRKDRKHDVVYMLKGLLWYGNCGRRYTTEAGLKTQYRRRRDGTKEKVQTNQVTRRYRCTKLGCPRRLIYSNAIESRVWEKVVDFVTRPDQVLAIAEEQERHLQDGGMLTQLEKARNQLETVDGERGRAFQLFQKGYIDETELDIRMKGITERLEFHAEEVKRLEDEAGKVNDTLARIQDFLRNTSKVTQRMDTMTDVERAEVVRVLVDKVTVGADGNIQMVIAIGERGVTPVSAKGSA